MIRNDICPNCGIELDYNKVNPVDGALIASWELSNPMARLFNLREGMICKNCGVNKRAQGLAAAILTSKFGYGCSTLVEWVVEANKQELQVAELNSCHELHPVLSKLKNLTYTEYGTESEENIEGLSFSDDSFDLVLHSETVEHVDNPRKAIDECRRVLKRSGLILFTTPVIWARKTRRRAHLEEGKIIKDLPGSYHGYKIDDYLVFHEFGGDINDMLGVEVVYSDPKAQNYVFSSPKEQANKHILQPYVLRWRERRALRGGISS